MYFQTILSTLRDFPTWQDAGQTDDHPDYRDETWVRCHSDGSVNFAAPPGGLIVEACLDDRFVEDDDERWDLFQDVSRENQEWLMFLDQLAQREGGWQA